MRAYRLKRDVPWVDDFGVTIKVDQVEEVCGLVQAATIPASNGYEDYEAKVYVHIPTGRTFWKPQTIDYWGTANLVSHDGCYWVHRLPGGRRYIDLSNRPFSAIDLVKEVL